MTTDLDRTPSRAFYTWMIPLGAGLFLGGILWGAIRVPFSNPGEVVGPPAQTGLSPVDDFIAFGIFILLPALLLLLWNAWKPLAFPAHSQGPRSASAGDPGGRLFPWILVLFAVGTALNVPTYHAFGRFDPFHEGETLGSALSWLDGQVPYRDFFFFHGPFQDPLRSVLAFQWFGTSIGAHRALESLLKVALWVLLALSLIRLRPGGHRWAWSVLLLTCCLYVPFLFDVVIGPLSGLRDAASIREAFPAWRPYLDPLHLVILSGRELPLLAFLLVFLGLHQSVVRTNGALPPATALWTGAGFGLLPPLAFAYSVDRGVCVTVAAGILGWAYHSVLTRGAKGRKFFLLSAFGGGVLGCGILGMLLRWNIPGFVRYVFWELPSYKLLTDKLPYPIGEPFGFLNVSLLAFALFRLALGFLEARSAAGKGRGRTLETFLVRHGPKSLLALFAILCFRNVLERPDPDHFANNSLWILLFLAMEAADSLRGLRVPARAWTVALALTACVFGGFEFHRLIGPGLWEKNFPLRTEDRRFLDEERWETLKFLKGEMDAGEPFFAFTNDASWYYLMGRPAPTAYPCLWVAAARDRQEDVVKDLEAGKVRIILRQDGDWTSNLDGIPDRIRFPVVDRYIRDRYRLLRKIGDREILERKPEGEDL